MDTAEQAGMKGYHLAEKLGVDCGDELSEEGLWRTFLMVLNAKFEALDHQASIASYVAELCGWFANVESNIKWYVFYEA